MPLGRARTGLTENGSGNSNALWIFERDEGRGAIAKQMRVNGLAEGVLGPQLGRWHNYRDCPVLE